MAEVRMHDAMLPARYAPRVFRKRIQHQKNHFFIYIPVAMMRGLGWSKFTLINIRMLEGGIYLEHAGERPSGI